MPEKLTRNDGRRCNDNASNDDVRGSQRQSSLETSKVENKRSVEKKERANGDDEILASTNWVGEEDEMWD